ncbi:hypothetical protein ACH9D2_15540 [Kocuria sp. M4R2S49]|uniref:hypothetical protein n=1 Tax=Kocuria rhizosphaericola TaxID=3376284 RepID=UPI0037B67BEC
MHLLLVACVAASVVAHGWMAAGGGHGAGWSLVMAAMALACSFCVVDLLRRRHDSAPVRMALGMAAAMALIHVLMVPLMATAGAGTLHAHHGGGGTGSAAASTGGADHSTMFLLIAVELVAAGLAAAQLRRRPEKSAEYLR